nr:hypothetical protein [Tanacetum cinerariifolium]
MKSTCYQCSPKDFHEVDYTQLYGFLRYNQVEVNQMRAERFARAHDPLALMANSNNPYNYPVFYKDQPSQITDMQQSPPNNNYNPQPSFNQKYMQQPIINPKDISDPTTSMNMTLVIGVNGENQFTLYAGKNVGNQNRLIVSGIANPNVNQNGHGNVVATRAEGNGNANNRNQIWCYNCRGIGDLDEIKEVNENCILMVIYSKHRHRYTKLLDPILEPHQVQQNNSNVISAVSSVEQSAGTEKPHHDTVEETRAYFELLFNNLTIEVEKINTVNRKMKETNADLTTDLARYKN